MLSLIEQNFRRHHHYSSFYLFFIIAYLLLGFTNATNTTVNTSGGLIGFTEKIFDQKSNQSLTKTANESLNPNETSIFHRPIRMSDVRRIIILVIRLCVQGFIIVSFIRQF